MRVSQAQKAKPAGAARRSGKPGSGGGDFTLPSAQPGPSRAEFAAPAAVSSIDVIVALQGIAGPDEQNQKAAQSGVKILDMLDSIKVGILSGGVSSGDLERLKRMVEDKQRETQDPQLADILKQIDLRARVEIAKLRGSAA